MRRTSSVAVRKQISDDFLEASWPFAVAAIRARASRRVIILSFSLELEHNLQGKLDDARIASRAVGAEIGVHLLTGRIEPRRGKESRVLGMIPGVEQLGPELDVPRFREKRYPLAYVDVPVVDSGAAQDVDALVLLCSGRILTLIGRILSR